MKILFINLAVAVCFVAAACVCGESSGGRYGHISENRYNREVGRCYKSRNGSSYAFVRDVDKEISGPDEYEEYFTYDTVVDAYIKKNETAKTTEFRERFALEVGCEMYELRKLNALQETALLRESIKKGYSQSGTRGGR